MFGLTTTPGIAFGGPTIPAPSPGVPSVFVDLINDQTAAGNKTWTGTTTFNNTVTMSSNGTSEVILLKVQGISPSGYPSLQIDRATNIRSATVRWSTAGVDQWYGGLLYGGGIASNVWGLGPDFSLANARFAIYPAGATNLAAFRSGGADVLTLIPLNSGANSALSWGVQSSGLPTVAARSVGTRIVRYTSLSSVLVDHADGVFGGAVSGNWSSVPGATSAYEHRWYGGTTQIASLRGDGLLTTTGGQVEKLRIATTTPVTVAVTDFAIGVRLAVPGAVAVSLPGAAPAGTIYEVGDYTGDANSNNITVTPTSGTINGAANDVINTAYGVRRYRSDGTNYIRVA